MEGGYPAFIAIGSPAYRYNTDTELEDNMMSRPPYIAVALMVPWTDFIAFIDPAPSIRGAPVLLLLLDARNNQTIE